MSLFRTCVWWHTECGLNEEFDSSSLLVSKLNSTHDYVIVGSQVGILRIYQPSSEKQENEQLANYKPTDLLIEIQLSYPILQICVGRLVSGSQILQLAILHPRSVGVYSFVSKSGNTDHGVQNNVLLVYEHNLKRAPAYLVVGSFGGSQNRDFICVQSLDGMLTFWEQESFSFCCFLPEFLLPNPFVFVKSTDSFVTLNADWNIVSYRYKRLSEIGHNSNINDTDGLKFDPDWNFNIGEGILDIVAVESTMNETNIAVLGERNLFCFHDSGKLKFMKRFDFSPHCFHPYFIKGSNKLMIMVIAETNTLLIFENTTVRWSAQLTFLPTAVSRGFFPTLSGALVFLSDQGNLEFSYLGTEPQLFTAPPLQNQQLDFDKAEEELTMINKIIKSRRNNDTSLANSAAERELIINTKVNPHLEACTYENNIPKNSEEESVPMCSVEVEILPNSPFKEVQISFVVLHPLTANPSTYFVNNLEDSMTISTHIYLEEPHEVITLEVKVVVSHITNTGMPRILSKTSILPMKLVVTSVAPQKEAAHRITLNINQQAPALATLFPEFAGENSISLSSNAVGFKNFSNGSQVSILSAKSSQRYRLQSDSFATLNLLTTQLIERLKKHFENNSEFAITYNSSLPSEQFLEAIERHFQKYELVMQLQNVLGILAAQYRLIQKRLISKYKEKHPTPLNNLDVLMSETYTEIMDTSDQLQSERKELSKVQCELSCIINLMKTLITLMDLPKDILNKINSIFVVPVQDIDEQSWEDITDAAAASLLKTVLAKSEKDKLKNISNELDRVKDISKFKKRVLQVLDRIPKFNNSNTAIISDENEESKVYNDSETLNQQGNQIAISSVRAQSAKKTRTKLSLTPEEHEDV